MPTADARLLADDPRALFGSASKMFAVPYAAIRELQLEGLRYRFDALRPRVQLLDRLAERNGVDGIDDLATAKARLSRANATARLLLVDALHAIQHDRHAVAEEFVDRAITVLKEKK